MIERILKRNIEFEYRILEWLLNKLDKKFEYKILGWLLMIIKYYEVWHWLLRRIVR